MKKILVSLLVAATTLNFVACGSSDKKTNGGKEPSTGNEFTDAKVEISVQVEESWLPYYEQVKATVLETYKNATITFKTTGSFDHLTVIDSTDPTNTDVADVFALPADRFYGLAENNVLAALDAEAMAERIGGFKDFKGGLGGNFQMDGDYLAFPYNIETLVGFVNVANAEAAKIDTTKAIEMTELKHDQILSAVHDCWFGVGFANSANFELLREDLTSDATKDWADLTAEQKALFEGLYDYWAAHKEAGTSLWDKDAVWSYVDEQFKTGGSDAIKIDGPWATPGVKDLVGGGENLEVIPLTNITFKGQPLTHWKGGWALGVNARCEEDEAKMAISTAFIEEMVNPENAQELFKHTGKVLENVEPSAYEGIDAIDKKVIDATFAGYEAAPARPLFTEYGQVWGTWQGALLSWSAKNPANAEEAYAEVKAGFDAMMATFTE